jgi:hypothetical protein
LLVYKKNPVEDKSHRLYVPAVLQLAGLSVPVFAGPGCAGYPGRLIFFQEMCCKYKEKRNF